MLEKIHLQKFARRPLLQVLGEKESSCPQNKRRVLWPISQFSPERAGAGTEFTFPQNCPGPAASRRSFVQPRDDC